MKSKLILFFIIIVAAVFRFYDLNWDQGNHLHPDERFLTMVSTSMQLPKTFFQYLDPQTSLFNPANVNFKFYVYGIFPLTLNKLIAIAAHTDTYDLITLQGRFLSGLADILVIIFIFATCRLLETNHQLAKEVKYLACFFYAIAVLPIQLSHFFAVDTFVNLFVFSAIYFSLRFLTYHTLKNYFFSSILVGVALACKISAIYVFPLIALFMFLGFIKRFKRRSIFEKLFLIGIFSILYLITTYITLRITDPYLFESANLFNPTISSLFINNIEQLESFYDPNALFPPSVQWVSKPPIFFALNNIIFYGLGLGFFLTVLLGMWNILQQKKLILLCLLGWSLVFFLYQSMQKGDTIRYFIFIYPFFSLFAGLGLYSLYFLYKPFDKIFIFLTLLIVLIWPVSFFSIYTKPHTRVTASKWIYKNIPNSSRLLTESWDDGLPLPIPNQTKSFSSQQLAVFDHDTSEKWIKINGLLRESDYIILSSNRGWGSIPTLPDKYPKMTKFYHDLFAGKLIYKEIAEFTSYPSLEYLGIPISFPDDDAEEAFTVYDHPKVLIFQKISTK